MIDGSDGLYALALRVHRNVEYERKEKLQKKNEGFRRQMHAPPED
jgi:hypothetical protein